MADLPGVSAIAQTIGWVRDRLRSANTQIGRAFHRDSATTGSMMRESADVLDAANRHRPGFDDELLGRTQLRVANDPGRTWPHVMVSAGDTVFVGTVHYKKFDLPQTHALMQRLKDWLAATEGRERTILVEGRVPPPAADIRSAVETDRGEIAGIAFLARKAGVEPRSMEEALDVQAAALMRDHEPLDVFGYYVLRQMPQGIAAKREDPGFDMTAHLNEALDMFAHILPEGADARASLTELMARDYADTGFSGVFGKSDENWLMRETNDPGVTGIADGPVQEVALACNMRRDAHAAELIQQQVDSGSAVFAQFGIIHFDKIVPNVPAFAGSSVSRLPG